ncbi:MAG TPA: LysM peptidoglycan-binding domain-containing protein [Methylomirabilota bacterium]|jgi:nucleoid-associated protein YgaU|nr:LysM peptidoglycan-binding domain-containing protein [Methylomirabilota bacterium]
MKNYEQNNQRLPNFNVTAWDRSRQRLHAGAILFAACAIAAGAPIWAQDVAEVARRAQAHKPQQTKHKKHVYTEEDLKRARILTREDQELLAAKRRDAVAPGAEAASTLDVQALEHLPLGDVARMYRAMKELNHSQTSELAEYHLPVANAVLAYDKTEFVVPRPHVVDPVPYNTPAAPVFPNTDLTALRLNTLVVPPTPIVPAPAPNRAPTAKTFSASRTVAAKITFAVSKPNMLIPTAHEAPIAPVFANPEVVSLPAPGFVAPTTQPTLVAPAISNASAPRSIIVKYGDSLWKLAQINLGDGHRWHELAAINPGIVNPQHIVPGTPINVAATAPVAPTTPSDSNVTVHKGDSLWKIARKKLGFGGFWGCIAKANPEIQNANLIYTGQVLAVPETCDTPSTK